MSPKSSLILFDIDGTLLTSGGAGETALRIGFAEEFGIEDDLRSVEIPGRTDSGIARRLLSRHGIPIHQENIERFLNRYLRYLGSLLPQRTGRLLPGVLPLLQTLQARHHIALGLLTGNLERGAQLKLRHYGVADFFSFGAYADDHPDRNELGKFARQRAQNLHGVEFLPENTYILGDTPHDIACARAIGARAIAIATGSFSRTQLAEHQPDSLLEDLSDLPSALAALGETP